MADAPDPIEIGIVLRTNILLGVVHGLTDLFRITDDLSRVRLGLKSPVLRVTHFSDTGAAGIVRTFDTLPDSGFHSDLVGPRMVIIPPRQTSDEGIEMSVKWADWLKARHAEGSVLGSICGGTFLLAQTGLLDGRRATTHKPSEPDLATLFPAIEVDVNASLTEEDDIITVGAVMAWTDLALVVVRRLLGSTAMMDTARFMSIEPPSLEQRFQKTFLPNMNHGDSAVLRSQYELHARGPSGINVNDMAKWSGLETRTFTRRFHRATGLRPGEYRQKLGIEKARELLEANTVPISQVASDIGYGDIASFRLTFAKQTGFSPSDYRSRFGHSRTID